MNKFRYLFKNMGFLFVGSFSSKILVFLLVPLYTAVLSTTEYGSYDLIYTTVQLLAPLLTLNVVDGILRFTVDAGLSDQKGVFTIGAKYILISTAIVLAAAAVGSWVFHIEFVNEFFLEFVLMYIAYLINQFAILFARGLDDTKGTAIGGVIGTICMVAFNLLFLLVFKWGLKGYFYANILSWIIPVFYLAIRDKFLRFWEWTQLGQTGKTLEKRMVSYCFPLVFNTMSWTINNLADRYVVIWMCGLEANGIYSVSYKIPAILNSIQSIFISAWQLSAIKELNSKEGPEFFSKTYQGCHSIMVLLCSGLIVGTRMIAQLLFANEFYTAWEFVPVLLLYVVFNTLSGTIGGVFTAAMDSKAFANSALVGATTNIVLNFVFVYFWGVMGAAVATVISSIVIWGMRFHYSKRHISWILNMKKCYLDFILLGMQAILMTRITHPAGYILQVALFLGMFLNNFATFKEPLKMLAGRLLKK